MIVYNKEDKILYIPDGIEGNGCSGCSEEELQNEYNKGKTDGINYQKSLLVSTAITENGTYSSENGYSEVSVNVPHTGYTQEELDEAYQSGIDYQKSLLTSTAITENGNYSRENGFSSVSVNVPQTGYTQQDLDNAYASGITTQKALLVSTAFTANGTYTRENGWNAVTVNVPQTGYTQQDLDDAYASGYTVGYNDGYEAGIEGCSGRYLGFEVISGGTIYWKHHNFDVNTEDVYLTIEYSINGGEWNSVTSSDIGSGATIAELNAGDIIQFRGNNNAYHIATGQYGQDSYFRGNITCNVSGNIMSLINSTGYSTLTSLESDYTFESLFGGTDDIYGDTSNIIKFVSAENLILPATTLSKWCYAGMFAACTTLTKIPVLPAITLSEGCYRSMFAGCTSLINVPSLPATTLANGCYHSMFSGCTSLVSAPVLPATTVANNCYQYMFAGCTSLPYAPALPATTLANNCYRDMFNGCTNLNYVKCLATDISASSCTNGWLSNVAATGTFVTPSTTNWTTGGNGIPTGWTRVNSDA